MTVPQSLFVKLARQSAATWSAVGARSFPGRLTIETVGSVYRFSNGIFDGRLRKPASDFEIPTRWTDVRLIGFLADEGGAWSLSPRWRRGARAVLWNPRMEDVNAFFVTSPTRVLAFEAPPVLSTPAPVAARSHFVRKRPDGRTVVEPVPASVTRVHRIGARS